MSAGEPRGPGGPDADGPVGTSEPVGTGGPVGAGEPVGTGGPVGPSEPSTGGPVVPDGPVTPGATGWRNPVGLVALIVGIVALVLAVIPYACFAAGLPALAAIVLGIVGLVLQGRRRGTSIAGLVLGAVALIVAIVLSSILIAGFVASAVRGLPDVTDLPSFGPEPQASGSALAAGPHTVTYRITGSGTASVVYSTFANGHTAFAQDRSVTLPSQRRQTVHIAHADSFSDFTVTAVTVNGSSRLGCSIAIDGHVVVQRSSRGDSGFETVNCSVRG